MLEWTEIDSNGDITSPLALKILGATTGDEAALALCGELDLATAPDFERAWEQMLRAPIAALMIDLADLEFLDSSGLRALNDARVATEARQVRFSLFAPSSAVRRVFEVTGMGSLFDIRRESPGERAAS